MDCEVVVPEVGSGNIECHGGKSDEGDKSDCGLHC